MTLFDPRHYTPPVTAVPLEPWKGPWKNSNHWGNSAKDLAMPLEADQPVALFEGDEVVGPPRVQSLILSRGVRSTVTSNADFRGFIEYSIGGQSDNFLVDWTRGAQLSLVCNWVRVTALTYAPNSNQVYSGGGRVTIGAAIAEGTIEKNEPCTFTEPYFKLSGAGAGPGPFPTAKSITVPQFARSLVVHVSNDGTAQPAPSPSGLLIQLITAGNQIVRYDSSQLVAGGLDTGIMIPAGISAARFENTSANLYLIVPIWRLAL